MMNKNMNLILEGLNESRADTARNGGGLKIADTVTIGKCVKGISEKDLKNILSFVKGDVQSKEMIDLTDKTFKGIVVDIVRVDTKNPITSYDIEIKNSNNNPWNRAWTPILKKSGASKYTNGWMLTGYKSKSDADKDYQRIQDTLKNMKFDDDEDDDWD